MFIFAFIVNTLIGGSEKMLLSFMSESVWPVFSSKRFMVSGLFFFFLSLFLLFLWAAPAAYGGSQARGRIGAVAAGLRQSYSNTGSEPRLQPTPQLTATPDP